MEITKEFFILFLEEPVCRHDSTKQHNENGNNKRVFYSLLEEPVVITLVLFAALFVILRVLFVAIKNRLKRFEFGLDNVKLQCIKDLPNINVLRSDNYTDNLVAKYGNRHMCYEYSMGRNTVLVCLYKDEPFLCFHDETTKSLRFVFANEDMRKSVNEALTTLFLNSRQNCHYSTSSPEPPGAEGNMFSSFKTRVSIYHSFEFTASGRCKLMAYLFKDFYHPNKDEILQFLYSRVSKNEGGVFLLEGCSGAGKTQFAKNVMEYVNTYTKSEPIVPVSTSSPPIPCSLFYTNTTKVLPLLSSKCRNGIIVFDEFDKMITHMLRDLNQNSTRLQLIKKNRATRESERETLIQKVLETPFLKVLTDKLEEADKILKALDTEEDSIRETTIEYYAWRFMNLFQTILPLRVQNGEFFIFTLNSSETFLKMFSEEQKNLLRDNRFEKITFNQFKEADVVNVLQKRFAFSAAKATKLASAFRAKNLMSMASITQVVEIADKRTSGSREDNVLNAIKWKFDNQIKLHKPIELL